MGFTKAGGLRGGAAPPPFANTRIRATFPNSKHGDDMMLVFLLHAWISNSNIHNDTNTEKNKY